MSVDRGKIRDFVLSAVEQHGEVPKPAAVSEALGVSPTIVSSVYAALRFAGKLPAIMRGIPKGRVRGANAVMEFLAEHNRLPTADEIGVSERVLKNSVTRLVKKGRIKVSHTVA